MESTEPGSSLPTALPAAPRAADSRPAARPGTGDQDAELATVHVERHGEQSLAVVTGELDMSNSEEVYQHLLDAAKESTSIVIDLVDLAFIDSAGISVLHRIHRVLATAGTAVQVATGEDTAVARTLALAGMDRVLPVTLRPTTADR
ncbi:MAG: STAS domain-containing protein [Actinomycetales bacterium]|nr:STAS domain-containing protein [Actinomycetales bacterium]